MLASFAKRNVETALMMPGPSGQEVRRRNKSEVRRSGAGVCSRELGNERRPGEVPGAHALPGARVVVLPQPLSGDRLEEPPRKDGRLVGVAEPEQAEPDKPGRVDPGGAPPVAAQEEVAVAGREGALGRRHRRGRHREPEALGAEQMLLDEA